MNNQDHPKNIQGILKVVYVRTAYIHPPQNEEGKVTHTENKETERDKVTDPGGHVTTYLNTSKISLS